MNPDLQSDIQAGRPAVTVYVTSADGGDITSKWSEHESSGRAAQAAMAGLNNAWSCEAVLYAGKPTTRCTLTARPRIKMIFMRVLDGRVPGPGNPNSVPTADASTTYTAPELVATLAAIRAEVSPGRVGVMDLTLAHGFDHNDHVATGALMFDATRADGLPREIKIYRAYSVYEPSFAVPPLPLAEPPNLTEAQYREKLRIVNVYQPPPIDVSWDEWSRRLYFIRALSGGAPGAGVSVRTSDGHCLNSTGASVNLATCDGSNTQQWRLSGHQVVSADERCLGGADGTAVTIKACTAGAADQRWTLLDNGQLHGVGVNCLAVAENKVGAVDCVADMSQPRFSPPASQRWSF